MRAPRVEPLRVGVVGLGVIAPFYLAALQRGRTARLASACDLDEQALRPLRGRVPCYRGHRDLLRAGGIDAVVVTVPNHAHAEVCRDALAAGLPVCVEKPLATDPADGAALVHEARSRGLTLFTVFHRRYNAAVTALARALEPSVPIESVTIRYLERIEDHIGRDRWYLDPARCGGGCVADNGPNAYDLAQLLAGPVALAGAEVVRDAHGVDRQARVLLRAEAGALVRVELDWSYPGECKDVEVRLADGTVHRADMLHGYPGFKQSLWHEYDAALADFAAAVRSGAPRTDSGLAILSLVQDTYRAGRHSAPLQEGR